MSLPRSVTDVLPFSWAGFKVAPTYTYVLNLTAPIEEMLAGFTAKRRNDLSRARRDGLETRKVTNLPALSKRMISTFEP
jgi:hypothetical protein